MPALPVAHSCSYSYLGGWDWEHCGQPVLKTPISKITRRRMDWRGDSTVQCLLCKHEAPRASEVAQVVEHLLSKCEAPSSTKKTKQNKTKPPERRVTLLLHEEVAWSLRTQWEKYSFPYLKKKSSALKLNFKVFFNIRNAERISYE
jgi:hypothetical protein